MNRILFFLFIAISTSLYAFKGDDNILDPELEADFRIYTNNVEINSIAARSLQMQTTYNEYKLKIVPQRTGFVSFTISDIQFRTTVNVPDLIFRIEAVGYIDGEEIRPNFNTDKVNRDLYIDGSKIYFKQIQGGIPVWFNENVDSVKLIYSNSYGLELPQYHLLADIRLLPALDVVPNPPMQPKEEGHNVMVALDVSSSVTKAEKKRMFVSFRRFTGNMEFAEADSSIAYVNFGTVVTDEHEVQTKKEFRKTVRKDGLKYKDDEEEVIYTNWSAPMMRALEEKPKTLILVTDNWSNYYNNSPELFTTHFPQLVELSNRLKQNGTRVIFVTVGFRQENANETLLSYLSNGLNTRIIHEERNELHLMSPETDVVSVQDYATLRQLDFSVLFPKESKKVELAQE